MERRNRSLKALNELIHIDSLDSLQRVKSLEIWNNKYLKDKEISDFDLEHSDLLKLLELFYKSISFLKEYKERTRQEMISNKNMKKFLNN